jgi:amino acid adenylation domain-containing protein
MMMNAPVLLHDYFDESVRKYPGKEALIYGDERYTYSDLYQRVNILADVLVNLGLKRQDRVLIFMDNSPEEVISFYATMKAGGIFAIINSSVQLPKFTYIVNDAKPAVIIADYNKRKVVNNALKACNHHCLIIWVGADESARRSHDNSNTYFWSCIFTFSALSSGDYEAQYTHVNRCLDIDLAGLIYTSGSTGEPKGVMESHRSIISAARSIIQYLENTPDDIILNTLPLSFDYGLYQVIMALMFGGTIVLERSFIFLSRVLSLIEKERVTGFPIVPTIVAMIFKTIDLDSFNLNSLRYLTNTGAAFPVEHIKRLRKALPHVQIYSMFGLTECKRISYLPPHKIDEKPDSVGKPMPNCEVFILDEEGEQVKTGQVGELVVRGTNVMQGYWNAPKQTAKAFRPALGFSENLLFTGDFFKQDSEGFLYFLGRNDDMIKSRGERISAKEVEHIINQFDGINECAVVGVDDDILGQALKAYVSALPGVELTQKQIIEYCAKNMEPFSVPKYIEFMEELPKTPHGKVDKKILKVNTVKRTS